MTPWIGQIGRQTRDRDQTDKRQISGRQTNQKDVDHMDRQTDKRERERSVIQTRKRDETDR